MPNAFDVLKERGFVQQVTDEDAVRTAFDEGRVTAYVGYDPTAGSLHVGHLFTVMPLVHLERLGHRPVVVLGGGTAMVGDPSGKTEMRQMLDVEAIEANVQRFRHQIGALLDVESGKTLMVNNAEWLRELRYIDFLRDVGRHFSVNRMLSAEAYKLRMEKGLSFIEFNYQLLQAYDFLELFRRYDCTLQMGGDDQWGNILAGVDLIRRVTQGHAQGLTFPLQLTATGQKMGKTAAGAVWLDADMLAPYEYFQYWVNSHDDDVVARLGHFTFLPMEEVNAVGELSGADLNLAKSVLAYEATKLIHGADAAREAHAAAMGAFGGRTIPSSLLPSSDVPRAVEAKVESLPTTEVSAASLKEGLPILDTLVESGLAKSKGAARRLIDQGAIRVNEAKVDDHYFKITSDHLEGDAVLVRAGKKRVHRIVAS